MIPKTINYNNFSSRYPMATGQTVADKDEIIANCEETIAKMQERLKTEKKPAIRARCEEIIQNSLETIERARVAKLILQKNPFSKLCDQKSRRR